ncbi:hypothetical protein [Sphingomonas sp. BK235]|jgi:hypothetical protein|uniref:hypothetical protein n=1 Tax=Sphingomonas sp. BK235 TaxID=2512131 RepID=UPI00105070DA|nr:hypothetical protein [Sphingomonas sp. BK235]TCP34346.1 hypothetical protein EV292_104338 [Sphingomonas sp. BK235]
MHRALAPAAVLLLVAAPAQAQIQPDFTQIGQAVNGLAFPVTMNMCNAGFCGPQRDSGARAPSRRGRASASALAATSGAPARAGTAVAIGTYEASDALAKQTLDGYVARIRRSDPRAAAQVAREFGRHDYRTVYRGIVGDAGFRADSVSDAMAAYMMMAWLIANKGTREPSATEALGLRRQFAARAAAAPEVLSNRAKLGEELKLLVVTLNAGMQSAQRERTMDRYADGVATMVQRQYGLDLRRLRLSADGFVDA